jgi:hypothetical protein
MASILAAAAREVSEILEGGAARLKCNVDFEQNASLQTLYRDVLGLAYRLKNTTQTNWDSRDVDFFFTDQDLGTLRELTASPGVYRRELELSHQQRQTLSRFSDALTRYLRVK